MLCRQTPSVTLCRHRLPAVLRTLPITLAAWGVLSAFGVVVLSRLPAAHARRWFPALPTIGAAALVVGLHTTGLAVGAVTGLVVLAIAGFLITMIWRPTPFRVFVDSETLLALFLASVAGLAAWSIAVLPQHEVDDPPRTVSVTLNHDAHIFVALADWWDGHRIFDAPPESAPPGVAWARIHDDLGARMGQDLVQGALSGTLDEDPDRTWYPITALFVLLIPGAAMAAAPALGASSWTGLAAGTVVSLSASVIGQVYNQNSASLLGVPLVIATLAVLAETIDADSERPPQWFTALLLAALVGSYSEFLPVLVPTFVLFALARPPGRILTAIKNGAIVVGIAVVIAPVVWLNAARSSYETASGSFRPAVLSPFFEVSPETFVQRALGTASRFPPTPSFNAPDIGPLGIAAILCVVAFGAIALVFSARRTLWISFAVASGALFVYLTWVDKFPYGQQRAVDTAVPLWLFIAGLGTAVVGRWTGRRPLVAAMPAVLFVAVVVPPNVETSVDTVEASPVGSRTADASFDEAVAWVDELDAGGERTFAGSSVYFETAWLGDAFNDRPLGYMYVPSALTHTTEFAYWKGLRRYAIVSQFDFVDADKGSIVDENERFRLLDTSSGDVTIALPVVGWGFDTPEHHALDGAELVVATNVANAELSLQATPLLHVTQFFVETKAGKRLGAVSFDGPRTTASVPLPPGDFHHLVIRAAEPIPNALLLDVDAVTVR